MTVFPAPYAPAPEDLYLWMDPVPRRGYENMAVDEVLSRRPEAWLRVYRWSRPAVSFGCFDTVSEASRLFPGEGIEYIRRWTGGGIVDHRIGYTYTVTLPAQEKLIYPPSGYLYEWIHGALAQALRACGVSCSLLSQDAPDGGRACWSSPVTSDLVDEQGRKLAGAGQRRHLGAVLHQGLIQQCEPSGEWPYLLAEALAPRVVTVVAEEPFPGFSDEVQKTLHSRYLSAAWNDESRGRRKPSSL